MAKYMLNHFCSVVFEREFGWCPKLGDRLFLGDTLYEVVDVRGTDCLIDEVSCD